MKRVVVMLMAVGLVSVSQAVIIDDFESYLTGQANVGADTGGIWVGIPDWTGNPEIATDGSNQWFRNYGNLNDARGARRDLDVVSGGTVTLDFDLWTDTTVNDMSFGLAESGGTVWGWGDFAAYVTITAGDLRARNGGANEVIVAGGFAPGEVHHIQIIADVTAGLYDVFYDGTLYADDFGFRNGPVTVDTFKVLSNAGGAGDWVNLDNINFVPEPATLALLGLGALVLRRKR